MCKLVNYLIVIIIFYLLLIIIVRFFGSLQMVKVDLNSFDREHNYGCGLA